ncbi:HTH domain-containing protein [Allopusillimonas soli]|uniref:Helix-turn-helix domain-containing protein n=1 Tax=Allopusillimonas soli TaxID=659016 RepID=A0A853FHD7_9BURK|nr:helix-turn-helix domain-containing protein [Allopusillimonas soli]NYT39052.1 helix-turn-helix domain-containing protein [Allopusillimonas soli]TEA69516.1 HTH domain-containing protein [Allopusillimonas soli]
MAANVKTSSPSSLGRALDILSLFSVASPLLTAEEIAAVLGYTRSTAYRYLKELCDAGLIANAPESAYTLGPRIVELERMLALTDPLYRAGQQVLASEHCDNHALLLHSLYQDKVLCIYKVGPDVLRHNGQQITIRRARGIPFSLFQGAASLAALAHLSSHRIKQAYLGNEEAVRAAGLGQNWLEFRHALAGIRRSGYATSYEQITPFVMGIAVPILSLQDQRLIGSLARACPSAAMPSDSVPRHAPALRALSLRIAQEYARITHA